MVALVATLLAWAGLGASFVVALAAVVRMAGPVSGGDDVSGAIHLPGPVRTVIVTLFVLAAGVFLMDLLRRSLAREKGEGEGEPGPEAAPAPPWLRRLTLILSVVNVGVLAYLLWRAGILQGGLFSGPGGLAGGLDAGPVPLSAPAVFNWAFGILAVAAGLGALGLALWVALGDRLAREDADDDGGAPAVPLDALVEESVEDLRAEPDARRAIVRCYARFERVAAESGLERKAWLTPMEFMREVLARLAVPRAAVPTLTGLFELARFSHHALGAPERERALEALQEIRTAIEAGDGDAGPR